MAFTFNPIQFQVIPERKKPNIATDIIKASADSIQTAMNTYSKARQQELDNEYRAAQAKAAEDQQKFSNDMATKNYNLAVSNANNAKAYQEAQLAAEQAKAKQERLDKIDERNRNEEMAKLANAISEYRTKVSSINSDKNITASDKVAHTKGLQSNIDRNLQEYRNRFGEVAYKDLLDKMRQEDFMSKLSDTQSSNIRKANAKAPEKTSLGGFDFGG